MASDGEGNIESNIPIELLLQVQLTPYSPDVLDASILWTESRDVGDGYRAVRMVNNINLNLDAWNADKEHGGVRDGTTVALWEWWKGDNRNQHWKIVRYCKSCNIAVQKLIVLLGTLKTCTLPLFPCRQVYVPFKIQPSSLLRPFILFCGGGWGYILTLRLHVV